MTEDDDRRRQLEQIYTYLKGAPLAQLQESWEACRKIGHDRTQLLLYIEEHRLDPKVPTDHFPKRKKLEQISLAQLVAFEKEIKRALAGR